MKRPLEVIALKRILPIANISANQDHLVNLRDYTKVIGACAMTQPRLQLVTVLLAIP